VLTRVSARFTSRFCRSHHPHQRSDPLVAFARSAVDLDFAGFLVFPRSAGASSSRLSGQANVSVSFCRHIRMAHAEQGASAESTGDTRRVSEQGATCWRNTRHAASGFEGPHRSVSPVGRNFPEPSGM
jgi:hypothetical protein